MVADIWMVLKRKYSVLEYSMRFCLIERSLYDDRNKKYLITVKKKLL